jgi:GTPase SAR1 family protein
VTDFFISYTQIDRHWAEWIAWQLEAAGYSTVLQAWDFRPGSNFVQAMQHAAAESDRTIAVLSPAYLQSGFTAAEWAAAFARDPTGMQGLLLPVRIHDCEPQGLLPQIVYIDLVGLDAEAARETLLAGVRRQRAKPTREPGFPGPSPRPITVPPLFPGSSPPALKTGRDVYHMQRNRSQMLEKVWLIWIKGLLEPSLHRLARIELNLETKPDAVDRPFGLLVQRPEQAPQRLPTSTPISQIFMDSGNALLILGEPGAGKTTLLLELTRDLLDRAKQDEYHLIPVVFNLASWAEKRSSLTDWLIDELNKRYDVPRKLAQVWIDAELIVPLLDGLDEVVADQREACAQAINTFLSEHGLLPIVICSRVADYKALTVRLRVPSAVIIQLLNRQQVQSYVEQAGVSLAGLRTVLQDDESLWELLNTPLMLSIAALAYRGRSANEIHSLGTKAEHRVQLFAAYTDAMFQRRAKATPYTREQTERWLTWLARAMQGHNQKIFNLEWMQPDWVPGRRQQQLITFITSVMSGLMSWLVSGLVSALIGSVESGLFFGLLLGLIFGLSVGISKPLRVFVVFGEQGMGFLSATRGIGSNWTPWKLLKLLRSLSPAPVAWHLSQLASPRHQK